LAEDALNLCEEGVLSIGDVFNRFWWTFTYKFESMRDLKNGKEAHLFLEDLSERLDNRIYPTLKKLVISESVKLVGIVVTISGTWAQMKRLDLSHRSGKKLSLSNRGARSKAEYNLLYYSQMPPWGYTQTNPSKSGWPTVTQI